MAKEHDEASNVEAFLGALGIVVVCFVDICIFGPDVIVTKPKELIEVLGVMGLLGFVLLRLSFFLFRKTEENATKQIKNSPGGS